MKKWVYFLLVFVMLFSLAACTDKTGNEADNSIDEMEIEDEAKEFHKILKPVTYREGEDVQSVYYKTVVIDGENYYEVQPEGEEPLQIPVSATTIYGIDDGDCYLDKITMTVDGADTAIYQLNVTLEAVTPETDTEKTDS